ncbi:MAG: HD domain-containing protein [Kiritimatiellae bacterium]|nr:HD domain-containing protein [Kiritimatiellia bacterium]
MTGNETGASSPFQQLIRVGIALTSTQDLSALLTLILSEARRMVDADAGTLYVREGAMLRAVAAQCRTLTERLGDGKAETLFDSLAVPVSPNSVCGSAALTKEVVNIPDLHAIEGARLAACSAAFDREHGYTTRAVLAVPMIDPEDEVIGVLQLINKRGPLQQAGFGELDVRISLALASQAAVAIRNARLTAQLRRAHRDALLGLSIAAEWRDRATAKHITRVTEYAGILGLAMGLPDGELDLLVQASPMHDVGKLGIPDAILHKPGKLDEQERRIMETHTLIGANILNSGASAVMRMARQIALYHHEKWDGSGYPKGLRGTAIPLCARIVALADVYDALSTRRCYKEAFAPEKVLEIVRQGAGAHFQPELVDALLAQLGRIYEIRDQFGDTQAELDAFRDYANIELKEPDEDQY